MTAREQDVIKLTLTEQQLLRALTTGASNKQIARDLKKSALTVRNQLHTLFLKIKVSNRVQAVGWYQNYVDATEAEKTLKSPRIPEPIRSSGWETV